MINRRRIFLTTLTGAFAALLAAPSWTSQTQFDTDLLAVQTAWAQANYRSANPESKQQALEAVAKQSEALAKRYPDRAEALV